MDNKIYLNAIMKASDSVEQLKNRIKNTEYQDNEYLWGGADVIITANKNVQKSGNWWDGNDYYVITPFAKELSWLFVELRDIFYENELIDYMNKYELFGRLANSANRYILTQDDFIGDKESLLFSVLHEGNSILNEILSTIPHNN